MKIILVYFGNRYKTHKQQLSIHGKWLNTYKSQLRQESQYIPMSTQFSLSTITLLHMYTFSGGVCGLTHSYTQPIRVGRKINIVDLMGFCFLTFEDVPLSTRSTFYYTGNLASFDVL